MDFCRGDQNIDITIFALDISISKLLWDIYPSLVTELLDATVQYG